MKEMISLQSVLKLAIPLFRFTIQLNRKMIKIKCKIDVLSERTCLDNFYYKKFMQNVNISYVFHFRSFMK